ncbi:hypothetical protein B0H13DRAFT_1889523 [Mycena leptocephala]|nr:hypothetical protein B0H13DRAFT_1889523 [Mycena leptocephala]
MIAPTSTLQLESGAWDRVVGCTALGLQLVQRTERACSSAKACSDEYGDSTRPKVKPGERNHKLVWCLNRGTWKEHWERDEGLDTEPYGVDEVDGERAEGTRGAEEGGEMKL